MKENLIICQIVKDYLIKNPSIRFTQALFNLNINMFENDRNPEMEKNLLRDPYNDKDSDVLERIKDI